MKSDGDLSWPLRRAARVHGDVVGVTAGDRSLSYEELARRVGGLGAALAELAERSGVRLTLPPARRLPPALEAAVFFVCSEALANVAKHAGAADLEVTIAAAGEQLLVSVADDGAGGADPARGTGLRGLADRVEALGGTLRVDSPAGGGTRLEARLPIATDDRH